MAHVHQTLELPQGYQHFSWYEQGRNEDGGWGVFLNDPKALKAHLSDDRGQELRLYTQHQIFYEEGILKHTRSSPNWDGGFVTYATCKHLMRTYKQDWKGTWIAGLCPSTCCNNTLLFVGCVSEQFASQAAMGTTLKRRAGIKDKQSYTNPRGDQYTFLPPKKRGPGVQALQCYDHHNYIPPLSHTRSIEFYKKSAGSTSERKDGLIPKWWRDIEYLYHGVRPSSFVLSPCFLFSKPMLWTTYNPGRAALKLSTEEFADSIKF